MLKTKAQYPADPASSLPWIRDSRNTPSACSKLIVLEIPQLLLPIRPQQHQRAISFNLSYR